MMKSCSDQNMAERRSASGNRQNKKYTTARLRTAQPTAARLTRMLSYKG